MTPTGLQISLEVGGEHVAVAIWRVDVGRIPLYLLDTGLPANSPQAAGITDRLYGGDVEHRLRQEIVLGIGGVRALRALGLHPQVFHTNEGHAGFLSLERIREHIAGGLSFAEAVEAVRAGGVFTTHTPVPAGIDRFPPDLMQKYFGGFAAQCGITLDELLAIGRRADEPDEHRFNMAVMGLRLAGALERRRRAARRGEPAHVPGAVAGRAGRRGADRVDHQRCPCPHLGGATHRLDLQLRDPPGVGRCRRQHVGRRPQARRRHDLGRS